jgi:hypothetical protein
MTIHYHRNVAQAKKDGGVNLAVTVHGICSENREVHGASVAKDVQNQSGHSKSIFFSL